MIFYVIVTHRNRSSMQLFSTPTFRRGPNLRHPQQLYSALLGTSVPPV